MGVPASKLQAKDTMKKDEWSREIGSRPQTCLRHKFLTHGKDVVRSRQKELPSQAPPLSHALCPQRETIQPLCFLRHRMEIRRVSPTGCAMAQGVIDFSHALGTDIQTYESDTPQPLPLKTSSPSSASSPEVEAGMVSPKLPLPSYIQRHFTRIISQNASRYLFSSALRHEVKTTKKGELPVFGVSGTGSF